MRRPWITGLLGMSLFAPARLHAQAVTIAHQPVGCVVAGHFAVFEARFDPAASVARARVYFQGEGMADWYFVDMKPRDDAFQGTLPKPTKSLKRINYYIEVLDQTAAGSRTADFAPEVVPEAGMCGKGLAVAGIAASASVAVGAAAGAPAIPAGFASTGVASATAARAASAARGGGHTALYVVGGLITAAGTAAIVSEVVGTGSNISMEGHVFLAAPAPPGSGSGSIPTGTAIAGAVVSTSLDAATATTDGTGAFTLQTSSPSHKGQGTVFTVTIRANGCQTLEQGRDWGDHSKDQIFSLRCP
jgi:hypothetical protein